MYIGKVLKFLVGKYAVVDFHQESGVNVAILLNLSEHTGRRFVVCSFREGDEEWSRGQYTDYVPAACSLYNRRLTES